MANEAVIIELLGNGGDPIRFTCATAIPKGSLLELSADRTVQVATTANAPFVGVAAMETDGTETSISAYTNGIFDMVSDAGTDIRGTLMALSDADNVIETGAAADLLSGSAVGFYLEAGTNAGTEAVRVLK